MVSMDKKGVMGAPRKGLNPSTITVNLYEEEVKMLEDIKRAINVEKNSEAFREIIHMMHESVCSKIAIEKKIIQSSSEVEKCQEMLKSINEASDEVKKTYLAEYYALKDVRKPRNETEYLKVHTRWIECNQLTNSIFPNLNSQSIYEQLEKERRK